MSNTFSGFKACSFLIDTEMTMLLLLQSSFCSKCILILISASFLFTECYIFIVFMLIFSSCCNVYSSADASFSTRVLLDSNLIFVIMPVKAYSDNFNWKGPPNAFNLKKHFPSLSSFVVSSVIRSFCNYLIQNQMQACPNQDHDQAELIQ